MRGGHLQRGAKNPGARVEEFFLAPGEGVDAPRGRLPSADDVAVRRGAHVLDDDPAPLAMIHLVESESKFVRAFRRGDYVAVGHRHPHPLESVQPFRARQSGDASR